MICDHKTMWDFSRGVGVDGSRLWTCSGCGFEGSWAKGWVYLGNIECLRCGWANIEAVSCPACSPKKIKNPRGAR